MRVTNFGGMAPRFAPSQLGSTMAQVAENVELYSGEIRPWFMPSTVDIPVPQGNVKALAYHRGRWIASVLYSEFSRGFLAGDARLFYTQDCKLKQLDEVCPDGEPTGRALGTVAPTTAPTLVVGAGGVGIGFTRFYVYTYVNEYNEESAPSLGSESITVKDGQAVTLSGIKPAPIGSTIRIYRTVQGTTTTTYKFVAELPYYTTEFVDAAPERDVAGNETLLSGFWTTPPDCLCGLTSMGGGFYAGFSGSNIYFSEPGFPFAWPARYRQKVDYPIVAIEAFANYNGSNVQNTLVIATEGYTYIATGSDPANLAIIKLPDLQPIQSARSMVSGPNGVLYAGLDGLVYIGAGGMRVITRNIMHRKEWEKYNPRSIHAVIYDGKYFGFYRHGETGGGFIYDYLDRATGISQEDKFTTLTLAVQAAFADPVEGLHFVGSNAGVNQLFKWEGSNVRMLGRWRSKDFVAPGLTSEDTLKVVANFPNHGAHGRRALKDFRDWVESQYGPNANCQDHLAQYLGERPELAHLACFAAAPTEPVEFMLWVDGRLKYSRYVYHWDPTRIKARRGIEWSFELRTRIPVREVHLGRTPANLVQSGVNQGGSDVDVGSSEGIAA